MADVQAKLGKVSKFEDGESTNAGGVGAGQLDPMPAPRQNRDVVARLAQAMLDVEVLARVIERDPPSAAEQLDCVRGSIQAAINAARAGDADTELASRNGADAVSGLGQIVAAYQVISGIPANLITTGEASKIPAHMNRPLARFTWHVLAEIDLVGTAHRVEVQLDEADGALTLCILDDGANSGPNVSARYLQRARQIATDIGAEFGARVEEDYGTTVCIRLPLD